MSAVSLETPKFAAMFDYLSAPDGGRNGDGAFVFGRKDQRLVRILSALIIPGNVQYGLITGGIGKDSGELALPAVRIPEAVYLGVHAENLGVPLGKLLLEVEARNGGENARFGIRKIAEDERQLPHSSLVVVAHATSLLRLRATLELEADNAQFGVEHFSSVPTNYSFQPDNPPDQLEAAREMLRLADWPTKGWLVAQPNLPLDLVEYARVVEPQLAAEILH